MKWKKYEKNMEISEESDEKKSKTPDFPSIKEQISGKTRSMFKFYRENAFQ